MSTEVWRLFRYRRASEFLFAELEKGELYCCHPDELNDPYDCRAEWTDAFQRALANKNLSDLRRTQLLNTQREFLQRDPRIDAGVCCFTINADNHLMWAQYADNYCGVCLFYEIPGDYLFKRYPIAEGNLFLAGCSRVHYGNNSFTDYLVSGNLYEASEDPTESIVTRLFTSKAQSWEHEREFRIILNKPGVIQIEPSFIKEINFGLRTSPEVQAQIARRATTVNPKISLGQISRSRHSDFGINFPGNDR